MNRLISHQLDRILNNKTLGSSELVKELNSYIFSIRSKKAEIVKTFRLAKIKLGHFEAVNSYLKEINSILKEENKSDLRDFLTSHSSNENEKLKTIFDKLHPKLKKVNRVITLSRSGTVLAILKLLHQKNKKIRVIVCESRPKFEGRLLAESLAREGIKTEIITDAMLGLFIPKVNAAIIGADVVLTNGNIVNKVGSKALALLCREYKKPLFVVTAKSKLSKKKSFKQKKENAQEVWDKNVKNLSICNIYFEEIEKKFITKIFME